MKRHKRKTGHELRWEANCCRELARRMVKLDSERLQPAVFDLAEALALARQDGSVDADDVHWLQKLTDELVLAGMRLYGINLALTNQAKNLEERAEIHDRVAERERAEQKQTGTRTHGAVAVPQPNTGGD